MTNLIRHSDTQENSTQILNEIFATFIAQYNYKIKGGKIGTRIANSEDVEEIKKIRLENLVKELIKRFTSSLDYIGTEKVIKSIRDFLKKQTSIGGEEDTTLESNPEGYLAKELLSTLDNNEYNKQPLDVSETQKGLLGKIQRISKT